MLRYGMEWYSTLLPVSPCLSTMTKRLSVDELVGMLDTLARREGHGEFLPDPGRVDLGGVAQKTI